MELMERPLAPFLASSPAYYRFGQVQTLACSARSPKP